MTDATTSNIMTVGARMLMVTAVIGIVSWLSIDYTRLAGGVTIVWIAGGLLVGILLTAAHDRWFAYVLAAFVGNLLARALHGDPAIEVIVRGFASTLEACIVAYALRYRVGDVSDISKLSLVSRVAPWSSVAACVLSALLVAALGAARGSEPFLMTFAAWFASHLLGIVIVATAFVIFRYRGRLLFARPTLRWNFVRTAGLVGATTLLVFSQTRYQLLFLIYPPLLFAVFRHHFDGAVLGIVVVVAVALGATILGYGPANLIDESSAQERIAMLQFFIATACLSTLPVVVVLSQSKRLKGALVASEGRLRAITDNLPASVAYIDAQQRYTFANAFLVETSNTDRASIIGRTVREVRGEQAYAMLEPRFEAALRGEHVTFEGELDSNGRHYHFQSAFIPDVAADGSVRGCYTMTFDVSERVLAQRELHRIAQHDSLSGLGNRNKFNDHLTPALARYRRSGRRVALFYLDIDHFKQINDTFGHAVGDVVLCEFANRLRANLRETDLAARLGGDEFALIIEDVKNFAGLNRIARKLVAAMRPEIVVDGARIRVTTSVGIGVSDATTTAESLMLAADKALYEAKAAGRNTFCLADAKTRPRTRPGTVADEIRLIRGGV